MLTAAEKELAAIDDLSSVVMSGCEPFTTAAAEPILLPYGMPSRNTTMRSSPSSATPITDPKKRAETIAAVVRFCRPQRLGPLVASRKRVQAQPAIS